MPLIKIEFEDNIYLFKYDIVYYEEGQLFIENSCYKTIAIKMSRYDAEKYIDTLSASYPITILTNNLNWIDE